MAKDERRYIWLDGSENDRLNAIWSRSGRRLIVTVHKKGAAAQVELKPDQVQTLARFLAETVAQAPGDR